MPYRVPSSFKSSSHCHFYQGAVRCRDLSDGLSPAALQSTELALALSPSEPLPTSRYSHFLFPPRCLFGPVRISQSFPALSCATAQSAFGSTARRLNASRWALQGRPWQRPFQLATRWFSIEACSFHSPPGRPPRFGAASRERSFQAVTSEVSAGGALALARGGRARPSHFPSALQSALARAVAARSVWLRSSQWPSGVAGSSRKPCAQTQGRRSWSP